MEPGKSREARRIPSSSLSRIIVFFMIQWLIHVLLLREVWTTKRKCGAKFKLIWKKGRRMTRMLIDIDIINPVISIEIDIVDCETMCQCDDGFIA